VHIGDCLAAHEQHIVLLNRKEIEAILPPAPDA
jgi:hypothetical protein